MSSSKRPSLAAAMQKAARPEAAPAISIAPVAADAPAERRGGFYAATRAGKKKLTAALDPAAHAEFRKVALDQDKKGEALLMEAINDLFSKYGKPPIA